MTTDELTLKCLKIETELITRFDYSNTQEVERKIDTLISLLGEAPQMIEAATLLYDEEKGKVADSIITNDKILNAKQSIQKMYIEGKLKVHSALYARTESCISQLRSALEGYRTIASSQKEQMKNEMWLSARQV